MIQLDQLEKTYSSKSGTVTAIKNVSLTIEDGDIYGIIGLSGAGKSTLVRCINLLEKPTAGRVLVDGEDLMQVSHKRLLEIRRNIGMIFQRFNLLEQRTVEENVRFPLEIAGNYKKEEIQKRVQDLLALVDISEKAKSYPAELSGGQKQRVAIARALASSPKYLLCDEATSALDPQTTESVLELLKRINQTLNVTIIVITHEMKVVEKICSKVAVVYNGSVIENDYVSNVFSDPKSDVSKQLIMPDLSRAIAENPNETKLRLIFEGKTAETAVISTLALKTGIPVNVSYADTKLYDGKLYGRMLITFPNDEDVLEKVTSYLNKVGVTFKKEL